MSEAMERAVEAAKGAVIGQPMNADQIERMIRAAFPILAEELMAAAQRAWPRAHTYASENADLYRAQDHAAETVIAALRTRIAEIAADHSPDAGKMVSGEIAGCG